jgi:hypothetical protein
MWHPAPELRLYTLLARTLGLHGSVTFTQLQSWPNGDTCRL